MLGRSNRLRSIGRLESGFWTLPLGASDVNVGGWCRTFSPLIFWVIPIIPRPLVIAFRTRSDKIVFVVSAAIRHRTQVVDMKKIRAQFVGFKAHGASTPEACAASSIEYPTRFLRGIAPTIRSDALVFWYGATAQGRISACLSIFNRISGFLSITDHSATVNSPVAIQAINTILIEFFQKDVHFIGQAPSNARQRYRGNGFRIKQNVANGVGLGGDPQHIHPQPASGI